MSALFSWPAGKQAALSFSFDDARVSQADYGVPILEEHGIKATFFVSFHNLKKRLDVWQRAVMNSHEIGNHTVHHPCGGNYAWSRNNILEEYSLARIEEELIEANARIEELLGVPALTFAYPCGQKYVGRGQQVQSYVPLIAKRFLAGRSFREDAPNDPVFCDLAQLYAIDADVTEGAYITEYIGRALKGNSWLILAMHNVGDGRQSIAPQVLEAVCRYAREHDNVLWTASIAEIAGYIQQNRNAIGYGMEATRL